MSLGTVAGAGFVCRGGLVGSAPTDTPIGRDLPVKIDPRLHRIVAAQPYPLLFATVSGAQRTGMTDWSTLLRLVPFALIATGTWMLTFKQAKGCRRVEVICLQRTLPPATSGRHPNPSCCQTSTDYPTLPLGRNPKDRRR